MTTNIINKTTGAEGYGVPGQDLQSGWAWKTDQAPVSTPSAEKTAPIGVLSTDNAEATIKNKAATLNSIAPPPVQGANSTVASPDKTSGTNTKTPPAPKAYFTNPMGQEAEFTADQLGDANNQKFLTDNGYVQTRTEGPNFDAASGLKADVASADDTYDQMAKQFLSYNVDSDPAFASYSQAIHSQYDQLRQAQSEQAALEAQNTSKGMTVLGARTGLSRYNARSFANARSQAKQSILEDANSKLADLTAKEGELVASARKSYSDGKISQFNAQMSALDKIRTHKEDALKTYQTTVADITKDIRDQNKLTRDNIRQSSRDAAVAGLVSQGITDPKQLLEYLNYDEQGKQTGDFTADEVAKTLKNVSPDGDLEKLSGSLRDFYILKGHNKLPASITSLPEDQQLFSYLKQIKSATALGGTTGAKITKTDVHDLNLPLSTIGMSQKDIFNSLQSKEPAAWFVERVQNEKQQDVLPDVMKQAWDEYRKDAIAKAEGTATKDSPNYTKAHEYFASTYDGLDEDQLGQISDQVVTYVNGGMSYKDAIAQTEADIKG